MGRQSEEHDQYFVFRGHAGSELFLFFFSSPSSSSSSVPSNQTIQCDMRHVGSWLATLDPAVGFVWGSSGFRALHFIFYFW